LCSPASCHGGAAAPPWQLAGLHKGQAAILRRLIPEPDSPELRDKIARLRGELEAANRETEAAEIADKYEEARRSHAAAQRLADELNPLLKATEPYQWRVASSLWAERSYPFRSSFLETIHTYYGDVVRQVDFQSQAEAARRQINDWVARQTSDRVKGLFLAGSLDSLTRLVIANAVYFQGQWLTPFPPGSTRAEDFHLADGTKLSTPMMSNYVCESAGYGAFRGDGSAFKTPLEIPEAMSDDDPSLYPNEHGFTAVRLPYQGDKLFMAIIVPRAAAGLGSLEEKLAAKGMKPWLDGIATRAVQVRLPKFKLESEYPLDRSLRALGMVRAFNPPDGPEGAQLDRMTDSRGAAHQLYISGSSD